MFSMAVWRGTVAGPLHWRAGWQTGSLARPIALNAYFCQENCPLLNYPNETMSPMPYKSGKVLLLLRIVASKAASCQFEHIPVRMRKAARPQGQSNGRRETFGLS